MGHEVMRFCTMVGLAGCNELAAFGSAFLYFYGASIFVVCVVVLACIIPGSGGDCHPLRLEK
jgi:hypothetical protein